MTEKQIEKNRLLIKKYRAVLSSEKAKFGGFFDNNGIRYYVADLYMRTTDYKGVITYKKWFEKNFPDDIGSVVLSLSWSSAYYELGKETEAKIYAIDTAFQNVYLHQLLFNKEVSLFDMYEDQYNILEYAQSVVTKLKKRITTSYLSWLSSFIQSEEYTMPVNRFIALNKLLKDEHNSEKRGELLSHIRQLSVANKDRKK